MKIALLDHMTGANLGDAATQDAVIQNLTTRQPDVELCFISHDPEQTLARHGVLGFPLQPSDEHRSTADDDAGPDSDTVVPETEAPAGSRFKQGLGKVPGLRRTFHAMVWLRTELGFLLRSYRRLRGIDIMVVSGGGQLDDTWGGAWEAPYNLLRWSVLARLRRARVVYLCVGVGPLATDLSKRFSVLALRLAELRSFRDKESAELVASIGVASENTVYPDLANSLPIHAERKDVRTQSNSMTIGIIPLPYMSPLLYPQHDSSVYDAYINALAEFCVRIAKQGHETHLLMGDIYQDKLVNQDILKTLHKYGPEDIAGMIRPRPVETVESLVQGVINIDIMVTSRFHGVLLAQLVGKPVIAASYHQKIDSLMAEAGQDNQCLPIEKVHADWLHNSFNTVVSDYTAISQRIRQRVIDRQQELDKLYDQLFGTNV